MARIGSVLLVVAMCFVKFSHAMPTQSEVSAASFQPEVSDGNCETCKSIVTDLENKLNDPQLQDAVVSFVLTTVCPLLPADAAKTCSQEARVLVAQIAASIQQTFTPEDVCNYMGMCSTDLLFKVLSTAKDTFKGLSSKFATALPMLEGKACTLCSSIVDKLKQFMVDDNLNLDKVNAFFEQLAQACESADSSTSDQCQELVGQLRALVVKVIEDVDEGKVCDLMGVCGSQPANNAASSLQDNKDKLGQLFEQLGKLPLDQPTPENCATCEEIIAQIAAIIQNPENQQQVFDLMKQGCSVLGSFEQMCDDIVDEYGPMLMATIVAYMQPEQVCTDLGYCQGTLA